MIPISATQAYYRLQQHIAASDLQPVPTRNGPAYEFDQLVLTLVRDEPAIDLVWNPARRTNPYYAAAEVLWLLSDDSTVDFITLFAPQYSQFANGGSAYGHYGQRLHNTDQLNRAREYLRQNPEGRQCVLSMWQASDLTSAVAGTIKDIPCTIGITLRYSKTANALCMTNIMRSNDIWLGLPYDLFYFGCIAHLISSDYPSSRLQVMHVVHNMHLYEKNATKFLNIPTDSRACDAGQPHGWRQICWGLDFGSFTSIRIFIRELLVPSIRNRSLAFDKMSVDLHGTMLGDLYALAYAKHIPDQQARLEFVEQYVFSLNLRRVVSLFESKE